MAMISCEEVGVNGLGIPALRNRVREMRKVDSSRPDDRRIILARG